MTKEQSLDAIYQSLQKLLGIHRQLMESVRAEKESLIVADLKKLQEITLGKEALIESVRAVEQQRQHAVAELAMLIKKPVRELNLANLIIQVQGFDLKRADQLRSVYQALQVLISRIQEQNLYNQAMVEKSLTHVDAMKRNVLGEAAPKSGTYNGRGHKTHGGGNSRLLSKEA